MKEKLNKKDIVKQLKDAMDRFFNEDIDMRYCFVIPMDYYKQHTAAEWAEAKRNYGGDALFFVLNGYGGDEYVLLDNGEIEKR